MKIETRFEDNYERMSEVYSLAIDGKQAFRVAAYGDSPEDNTFSRNLKDVLLIPELMSMAYNAGYRREPIAFEHFTEEE